MDCAHCIVNTPEDLRRSGSSRGFFASAHWVPSSLAISPKYRLVGPRSPTCLHARFTFFVCSFLQSTHFRHVPFLYSNVRHLPTKATRNKEQAIITRAVLSPLQLLCILHRKMSAKRRRRKINTFAASLACCFSDNGHHSPETFLFT